MANDNYFILLELQPTAGKTEIANKIATCEEQWKKNKDKPLPEIRESARKNLKELDSIKSIMLHWDEDQYAHSEYLRQKQEAKEICTKRENALKERIAYCDQLTDSDIKNFLKEYETYWLDEGDVRRLFEQQISSSAAGVNGQKFQPEKYLDKNTAYTIQSNLRQVMHTKKDATLYDFLGGSRTSSASALLQEATKQYERVKKDPQQTSSTAEKNLYNICIKLFTNEEEKGRYDRYLELIKYPAANSFIDNSVKSEKGDRYTPFTQAAAERIITTMWNMNRVPVQEALDFIKNYCAYNDYPIESLDEEGLISKYETVQIQEEQERRPDQELVIEELKGKLQVGQKKAEDLEKATHKCEEYRNKKVEADKGAGECKTAAEKLLAEWGKEPKKQRNILIICIIFHALMWVLALAVGEIINSGVVMGLWILLAVIVWLVTAIIGIRALIRMIRARSDEKVAAIKLNNDAEEATKDAKNYEEMLKDANEKLEEMINANNEYLILSGDYHTDPKAYKKGLEFVKEGSAKSIDRVNELVQQYFG